MARAHALLHSRADAPYLLSPYTLYRVLKGMSVVGMMKARGRAASARRAERVMNPELPGNYRGLETLSDHGASRGLQCTASCWVTL
jgi:hypothetical protein